jgi:hypothetical protein
MRQPEQAREPAGLSWLRANLGIVVVVLIVGGIAVAYMVSYIQARDREAEMEEAREELARSAEETTRRLAEFEALPYNRMLKRIEAEGGASLATVRANLLAADKSVTYEHLKKNADRYAGTPWAFEGKIIDIVEEKDLNGEDQTLALIAMGQDQAKLMWVIGDFTSEFVENNDVYVVGYLAGVIKTKAGAELPAFSARMMMTPSEVTRLLKAAKTN